MHDRPWEVWSMLNVGETFAWRQPRLPGERVLLVADLLLNHKFENTQTQCGSFHDSRDSRIQEPVSRRKAWLLGLQCAERGGLACVLGRLYMRRWACLRAFLGWRDSSLCGGGLGQSCPDSCGNPGTYGCLWEKIEFLSSFSSGLCAFWGSHPLLRHSWSGGSSGRSQLLISLCAVWGERVRLAEFG